VWSAGVTGGAKQALTGVGASAGVGAGEAIVLDTRELFMPRRQLGGEEIEPEIGRLGRAVNASELQLRELQPLLEVEQRQTQEEILQSHRMMLSDPVFLEDIRAAIRRDRINAEWAVQSVAHQLLEPLVHASDEYLRQRRDEVWFVAERIIRNLLGLTTVLPSQMPAPAVVIAHDLAAEDLIALAQHGAVAAIVTERGGQTSHTSIVARSLRIPAVVGVSQACTVIASGASVVVDGERGMVLVSPDETEIAHLQAQQRLPTPVPTDVVLEEESCTTRDGHPLQLEANVEFVEDVSVARALGASGIGLFRTELLFLGREDPPDEDEQYDCYRRALELMGGRPVTIRTADLGGHRPPGPWRGPHSSEPAMGIRGIRYMLRHRELFRTQLRALLRASAHGNLRVMFPLVSDISELWEARGEIASCRLALEREGLELPAHVPIGIMVETPSAAITMDRFASEVDFVAVGTNDLVQFLLAVDRDAQEVAYLYHPLHPAVLRLLGMIAESARTAGLAASVCGEMASDPLIALALIGLGFDSLSVPPRQLPVIRRVLRHASRAEVAAALAEALRLRTADEIGDFLRSRLGSL
jgi:phosphoenolpyruvate-protein phosphotransferase (PTS system enzyme I)